MFEQKCKYISNENQRNKLAVIYLAKVRFGRKKNGDKLGEQWIVCWLYSASGTRYLVSTAHT